MPDAFTVQEIADFAAAEREAHRRQQQEREVEIERLRGAYDPRHIYSREEIAQLLDPRRRAACSEFERMRIDVEVARAAKEGRILGGLDPLDRGAKGPAR
jgi:hypothetical protein